MSILVTGSTGTVGKQVVAQLVLKGAAVKALVRDPSKAEFVDGVEVVKADLTDVDSLRAAMKGVRTFFLLNAVTPDEVTQGLTALNLAKEAHIERIVYLSVIHADSYTNVPHFAGKYTMERMIEAQGLAATIIRPAYFIENDVSLKDALTGYGIYPMPIGNAGVNMVSTADIAEIAAIELLRRHNADNALPRETIDIVGPDTLTGEAIAAIWATALGRDIHYAGNDVVAFEENFRSFAPGWMAYDMRLMMERIQSDGMRAAPGTTEKLQSLLDRPLKSYSAFAKSMAQQWRQA